MSDYKNILVAADFSAGGEAAARRAANLAERFGASLTILHVLEHFPEDLPVDVIPPEDVDPQTYLTDRIRGQLEKLRAAIGRPQAALEIVISTHSANRDTSRPFSSPGHPSCTLVWTYASRFAWTSWLASGSSRRGVSSKSTGGGVAFLGVASPSVLRGASSRAPFLSPPDDI